LPFIVPKYATINEVEKNDFEQMLQEYQIQESIKLLSVDEIKAILNEYDPETYN
jgi:DNA-directed RNA polymerase subunit H (RpoH/RPB5)